MAYYKIIQSRVNSKYYGRAVTVGTTDEDNLMEFCKAESTAGKADVLAVLAALEEVMAEAMADGFKCHINGLGYFQLRAESNKVAAEADFSIKQLTGINVDFQEERSYDNNGVMTRGIADLNAVQWNLVNGTPANGSNPTTPTTPEQGGAPLGD